MPGSLAAGCRVNRNCLSSGLAPCLSRASLRKHPADARVVFRAAPVELVPSRTELASGLCLTPCVLPAVPGEVEQPVQTNAHFPEDLHESRSSRRRRRTSSTSACPRLAGQSARAGFRPDHPLAGPGAGCPHRTGVAGRRTATVVQVPGRTGGERDATRVRILCAHDSEGFAACGQRRHTGSALLRQPAGHRRAEHPLLCRRADLVVRRACAWHPVRHRRLPRERTEPPRADGTAAAGHCPGRPQQTAVCPAVCRPRRLQGGE